MRVACSIDASGFIERRLEDTRRIELYDIEEDEILSSELVDITEESLISSLVSHDVDTLICSNMDIPLMVKLSQASIEIVGGVRGKGGEAIKAWLRGELEQSDIVCQGSEGGCSGNCSSCGR